MIHVFKKCLITPHIHPLFLATIALVLGIWSQSIGWNFYVPFAFFLIFLILSYSFNNLLIALLGCVFLSGAALYQKNLNRAVSFQDTVLFKNIDAIITVTDIARSDHKFLRHRISGNIQELFDLQRQEKKYHRNDALLWYCTKNPSIRVGDKVQLKNCKINIPKQDSMKQYFLKQNIAGTIITQDYTLLYRPSFNIWRWLFEYRSNILKMLRDKLSHNSFNFMALLFFGNKEINKHHIAQIQEDFKRWGVSHYLARSGLHLIIFIFIWEMLLKIIPISFVLKQIIITVLTLIYMLFSWTSLSFARSLASFFLYKLGFFFQHQIHPVHVITSITFCSLLFNPFYLFFLDFQLSFGITFLLTWASHIQAQEPLIPKNS